MILHRVVLLSLLMLQCNAYAYAYSTGDLHVRHLAGIWKLTTTFNTDSVAPSSIPQCNTNIESGDDGHMNGDAFNPAKMVYPTSQDILLLLREDGHFMQYGEEVLQRVPSEEEKQKNQKGQNQWKKQGTKPKWGQIQDEWEQYRHTIDGIDILMRGRWDYVDGKLILATDRHPAPPTSTATTTKLSSIVPKQTMPSNQVKDTILEGKVVAFKDKSLQDNPALSSPSSPSIASSIPMAERDPTENFNFTSSSSIELSYTSSSSTTPTNKSSSYDIHLSVPNGKVKTGKYAYPIHHPSFFEQPLFDSIKMGSFHLQQIAGILNTKLHHDDDDDDNTVELFKKEDLMSKRYLLTSYPLPTIRQRRQRWSIKYNAFVDARPKSKEEEALEEQEKNDPFSIKTFEVQLFANNTFTTRKGLGQDTVLRGKWWIMGDHRDQLIMQVWRFGFGRSVSGSTYSEGSSLSQKDAVSYWGTIYEVEDQQPYSIMDKDSFSSTSNQQKITSHPLSWKGKRIEVNGNLMEGWALEPCSVARFTMVEITEDDDEEEEEVDDDDDDDDDEENDFLDASMGEFQ